MRANRFRVEVAATLLEETVDVHRLGVGLDGDVLWAVRRCVTPAALALVLHTTSTSGSRVQQHLHRLRVTPCTCEDHKPQPYKRPRTHEERMNNP